MTAILKEDLPEIGELNRSISPALDRIVRHCLEKNPDQRFQSARDLAFDIESLSGASSTAQAKAGQPTTVQRVRDFSLSSLSCSLPWPQRWDISSDTVEKPLLNSPITS
jgi:eukaryotic-like serine/threonine-protein kinase